MFNSEPFNTDVDAVLRDQGLETEAIEDLTRALEAEYTTLKTKALQYKKYSKGGNGGNMSIKDIIKQEQTSEEKRVREGGMKHTPGPWKPNEAIVANAPNTFVVTAGKWGSPNIAIVDTAENARLIAAAPELAEMLTEALTYARLGHKPSADTYKAWVDTLAKAGYGTEGE